MINEPVWCLNFFLSSHLQVRCSITFLEGENMNQSEVTAAEFEERSTRFFSAYGLVCLAGALWFLYSISMEFLGIR